MKVSGEALLKVKSMLEPGSTLLDIGAGKGEHASWFKMCGYNVKTNDILPGHDYEGDFNQISLRMPKFDCTWASHVLEHQLNVNTFIKNMKMVTKEGGVMAITVPPRKDRLVGGHVSLFTPLSLIYNMILAGLDCSDAAMCYYGYNISVVVRKKSINLPDLCFDRGDIETLNPYFPVEVKQNIDGFKHYEVNW